MKKSTLVFPILLGTALLAPAIERPDDDAVEKLPAIEVKSAPVQDQAEEAAPAQPQTLEQAQEVAPWLGVGGHPVDPNLAWHLNLEGGVLLELVAPDSPAAKSGLQARDIITSVDGQAIDSQESLREAILKHKTGEEITLGTIQKGKAADKKITLTDRPDNMPHMPIPQFDQNPQALPPGLPDALRQEIERKMRELQVPQLGANKGDMKQLELKLNEMLKDMPDVGPNNFGLNFKTQLNVQINDAEGSVELKSINGSKEVTIRDKEGKTLFEGPYDSPQDKAAVPDIYQERLKKIDLDGKGFHLQFKGANPLKKEKDHVE